MGTQERVPPRPEAPQPPPPPLVGVPPRPLVLPIRARVAPASRAADDDRVAVVAGGRPEEAELVEARGPHVLWRAEQDGGRPEDRVEQAIARRDGAGEGKEGDAQVDADQDADAAHYQRGDADQVDERVDQERRVVA